MSEEQLKVFLDKAKADTSLQKKLNAAASLETAIEIAKEAGFEITVEDIKSMKSAGLNCPTRSWKRRLRLIYGFSGHIF